MIEDEKIIGVGDYTEDDADIVEDVSGKYICPGFIDGHIHIESTMMTPVEFAKAVLPHGTTGVIADPHEIANVCGIEGVQFMLEASAELPVTVYIMLPSCVPSTALMNRGNAYCGGSRTAVYGSAHTWPCGNDELSGCHCERAGSAAEDRGCT